MIENTKQSLLSQTFLKAQSNLVVNKRRIYSIVALIINAILIIVSLSTEMFSPWVFDTHTWVVYFYFSLYSVDLLTIGFCIYYMMIDHKRNKGVKYYTFTLLNFFVLFFATFARYGSLLYVMIFNKVSGFSTLWILLAVLSWTIATLLMVIYRTTDIYFISFLIFCFFIFTIYELDKYEVIAPYFDNYSKFWLPANIYIIVGATYLLVDFIYLYVKTKNSYFILQLISISLIELVQCLWMIQNAFWFDQDNFLWNFLDALEYVWLISGLFALVYCFTYDFEKASFAKAEAKKLTDTSAKK